MNRLPSEHDFLALQEISEGKSKVNDLVLHYSSSNWSAPKVKPFIKNLPARGLVTLFLLDNRKVLCHFEHIGKGAHRDALKKHARARTQ